MVEIWCETEDGPSFRRNTLTTCREIIAKAAYRRMTNCTNPLYVNIVFPEDYSAPLSDFIMVNFKLLVDAFGSHIPPASLGLSYLSQLTKGNFHRPGITYHDCTLDASALRLPVDYSTIPMLSAFMELLKVNSRIHENFLYLGQLPANGPWPPPFYDIGAVLQRIPSLVFHKLISCFLPYQLLFPYRDYYIGMVIWSLGDTSIPWRSVSYIDGYASFMDWLETRGKLPSEIVNVMKLVRTLSYLPNRS